MKFNPSKGKKGSGCPEINSAVLNFQNHILNDYCSCVLF